MKSKTIIFPDRNPWLDRILTALCLALIVSTGTLLLAGMFGLLDGVL